MSERCPVFRWDSDIFVHVEALNPLPWQTWNRSQSPKCRQLRGARSKDNADGLFLFTQPLRLGGCSFCRSSARFFPSRIDLDLQLFPAKTSAFRYWHLRTILPEQGSLNCIHTPLEFPNSVSIFDPAMERSLFPARKRILTCRILRKHGT